MARPTKKTAVGRDTAAAATRRRSARASEALDAPVALDSDWYRVTPIEVRELADASGEQQPGPARPMIDRKLVPPYSLIDVGCARAFLCSPAFADGLRRAGVRGWSLAAAAHLTGRSVAGYPCAWLEIEGDLSTVSRRVVAALFEALADAGDERWFALEPVAASGAGTLTSTGPKPPPFPKAPRPRPKPLAALLSELADRAERDGHDLGTRSRAAVGRWPDPGLEMLLREHEGLRLHRGALDLVATKGFSLAKATDAARRLGAEPRDDERVFAASPGLGVFWAVTTAGTVRGLARTGLRYGPGTPFAAWFRDLIADLSAATAQPERLWALSLLGR